MNSVEPKNHGSPKLLNQKKIKYICYMLKAGPKKINNTFVTC